MREYFLPEDLIVAETKGLVADSTQIRLALVDKVSKGLITMDQMQAELKIIQKQAHGIGLYNREDFYKKNGVDLELAKENKKLKDLKNLNNKLNKSLPPKSSVTNKIKI